MRTAIVFICFISTLSLQAKTFSTGKKIHGRHLGATLSLDLYESYLSLHIDLRKQQSMQIGLGESEKKLYSIFLQNILTPGFLLLETTSYPLAHISTWLEKSHENLYQRFNYNEQNLLATLSAGPEEPYALSFFLGEIAPLWDSQKDTATTSKKQVGSIITGQLISLGDKHLEYNQLFPDWWLEYKWKIKGQRKTKNDFINFHFQFGFKLHENKNFYRFLLFGLSRERYNKYFYRFSLIENTGFDLLIEIPLEKTNQDDILKKYFIKTLGSVEKSFPLPWTNKVLPQIQIGVLWYQSKNILPDSNPPSRDTFQIFVKPNVKF